MIDQLKTWSIVAGSFVFVFVLWFMVAPLLGVGAAHVIGWWFHLIGLT